MADPFHPANQRFPQKYLSAALEIDTNYWIHETVFILFFFFSLLTQNTIDAASQSVHHHETGDLETQYATSLFWIHFYYVTNNPKEASSSITISEKIREFEDLCSRK